MAWWEFIVMQKEKKDLLKHPVFVRFLIFVFLGGEGPLLVAVGDSSRGLKSSAGPLSGTRATESIFDDVPDIRKKQTRQFFDFSMRDQCL
jgi:hypothetical protein